MSLSAMSRSPISLSLMALSPMCLFLQGAMMARGVSSNQVIVVEKRRWLLRSGLGWILVLFVSLVIMYLFQAFIFTCVAMFLDCLRLILFKRFVLLLFLFVLVYSEYYGTSCMQRFGSSWHVRNLRVKVLRLNKLDESIVSLHIRLFRSSANFRPFPQFILHSSQVVNNDTEDRFQLAQILVPKEVHLEQLAT